MNLSDFKVGDCKDWKFGLITRSVYRRSHTFFEINDTSDGWLTAVVNLETMQKLMDGEMSLSDLDWK